MLPLDLRPQHQTTLVTSRLMCYLLLTYYLGFSYFGEVLILTSVGTSSPLELIHSPNFFSIKSHIFTNVTSFSSFTLSQFALVVQGLSAFALVWLLTFNLNNSYMHFKWQFMGVFPLLLTFVVSGYIYF